MFTKEAILAAIIVSAAPGLYETLRAASPSVLAQISNALTTQSAIDSDDSTDCDSSESSDPDVMNSEN